MKTAILVLLFGLSQFAAAEDIVNCSTFTVTLTNASILSVTGLDETDRLHKLEIVQGDNERWVKIENNKTILNNDKLHTVGVTIDIGTSVKVIVVIDWAQFADGANVPATVLNEYPNGDTELRAYTRCAATRR